MAKTDKLSSEVIRDVRVKIRAVIAENPAWQHAVDDIINAARPQTPQAKRQAHRAAISIVVSQNAALAAVAKKIFEDAAVG